MYATVTMQASYTKVHLWSVLRYATTNLNEVCLFINDVQLYFWEKEEKRRVTWHSILY